MTDAQTFLAAAADAVFTLTAVAALVGVAAVVASAIDRAFGDGEPPDGSGLA